MTRIDPPWLSAPNTRAVMAALAPARPLFVGGCVRDALMARPTGDVDIAVVTPPEETLRLAAAAGLKALPTGLDHGVVTVISDHTPFEAATLRRDVATDGRRAVVAYTDRVAEDAARRDFTINALYADASGEVIDPLGEGLADIAARRIRFIGDPAARIREDYLRILRYFRFHAQFGIDAFDAEGLAVCRALADGLSGISAERIWAEMKKLLSAPDPEPALAAMGHCLAVILPGAAARPGLTAAERAMALPPRPIRRLARLGGAPEAALRLSRAEARALRDIARAEGMGPAAAAYRFGPERAEDRAALDAAAGKGPPADWRAAIARGAAATFPVRAADLKARGYAPGPELGAALNALEARWIAAGFAPGREALLQGLEGPGGDAG